ncbi:hypothetical protein LguiA_020965 [Lonicera macranthoides]
MSNIGSTSTNTNTNSGNMGAPFFHEFKKQASFFFKEKIKTARLALTDVTPAQLLIEEATNGNPWTPDTRTLKMISKAAFEVDDYWRIVDILHKRLERFDRKDWRLSYKALIVLEHLLTHGPESVAEEFQGDKEIMREMGSFQHIDEKGFNWGLNVRKKSEKILTLLNEGTLLKEERDRARKLSRGIEGFGSFCHRTSSGEGILHNLSLGTYVRSNSQFNDRGNKDEDLIQKRIQSLENTRDLKFGDIQTVESTKENVGPVKEDRGESRPLLGGGEDDHRHGVSIEEDHPFNESENLTSVSLLSTTEKILEAC